jgi:hypothetical protein
LRVDMAEAGGQMRRLREKCVYAVGHGLRPRVIATVMAACNACCWDRSSLRQLTTRWSIPLTWPSIIKRWETADGLQAGQRGKWSG